MTRILMDGNSTDCVSPLATPRKPFGPNLDPCG